MRKILLISFLVVPFFAKSQIITTIAGTGIQGFLGDGAAATSAEFYGPNSMAFDGAGNMYIVDASNYRIRKVNTLGIISEIAGNGTAGFMGDGGPATAAELDHPASIAIDFAGNIYTATGGDHRIRKINTAGIITTIAGTGTSGYNGDNIQATAAELNYPYVGKTDNAGNLYFSDYDNHRVRKISPSGIITTIAGNGMSGCSGDNGPATSATLRTPCWLSISTSGDFYVPDNSCRCIRKIDTAGIITTFAGTGAIGNTGDGGPATNATLSLPNGVAFDDSGNVFISDYGASVVRKVNSAGIISTIAGTGTAGYSGDGGPAISAEMTPNTMAVDASGNLFIADINNNRIREITYHPEAINNVQAPLNSVSIYPNPASGKVTIASPGLSQGEEVKSVEIINLIGQQLYKQSYNKASSVEIDVRNLANGIYFVKVNGVYGGKFVKE